MLLLLLFFFTADVTLPFRGGELPSQDINVSVLLVEYTT